MTPRTASAPIPACALKLRRGCTPPHVCSKRVRLLHGKYRAAEVFGCTGRGNLLATLMLAREMRRAPAKLRKFRAHCSISAPRLLLETAAARDQVQPMLAPTLLTERLILRPLALSDAPAIQRHFNNWNIIR